MTNIITPVDLVEDGERQYLNADGLFLPVDMDQQPTYDKPLSKEEAVIAEIAPGTIVKEKKGLAVVRTPGLVDRVVGALKEINPRKAAIAAAGIAAVLVPTVAHADGGFVKEELFAHDQGMLNDLKAGYTLDVVDGLDIGYFVRDRTSFDYDGKVVGHFMLNELSLGIDALKGVKPFVQMRFAGPNVIPQSGIGYATKIVDDLGLYVAGSTNLTGDPVGELMTSMNYGVDLPVGRMSLEGENFLWIGEDLVKGTARFHAGYSPIKGLMFGAAAEVDYNMDQPTEGRAGGFLRLGAGLVGKD
jgi:hypothetical protein